MGGLLKRPMEFPFRSVPSPSQPLGILEDIGGNVSMRCRTLSVPRIHLGFWQEVCSVRGLQDLLLESGRWTDLQESRPTISLQRRNGPLRLQEAVPGVVQAGVRRWVLTFCCNKDSKENHDYVDYVTVFLLLHGGGDLSPMMKMTMQRRHVATRWQQRVRKGSCRRCRER